MKTINSPSQNQVNDYRSPSRQDRQHLNFLDEEPEMIISEQVDIKGDVEFETYLAVYGSFEGSITTNLGNLHVGPTGIVVCDLKNMGTVVIEGTVMGNIQAEKLILRGQACVQGDVSCSSVEMGPHSTMIGQMKSIYDPIESSPVKTKPIKSKVVLFIIEPQMDFHQGGSCAVQGADLNSEAISDFISNNKEHIEEIIVALDSHHRMHISHGAFWTNSFDESPPPHTVITTSEIEDGSWRPRDSSKEILVQIYFDYCLTYSRELKEKSKMNIHIWPEHCLIGSPGHAVVPCIHKALQEWAQYSLNTVTYIMKGINSLTEMYSALCAEIPIATDPSTSLDIRTIAKLDMADKVLVCGQTLSHSINFTCRDLLNNWSSEVSKLNILYNEFVCFNGFENEAELFLSDMKNEGVYITSLADFKFN